MCISDVSFRLAELNLDYIQFSAFENRKEVFFLNAILRLKDVIKDRRNPPRLGGRYVIRNSFGRCFTPKFILYLFMFYQNTLIYILQTEHQAC